MEVKIPAYIHKLDSLVPTFLNEYSPTAEFDTGSINNYLASRIGCGLSSTEILQELVTKDMLFVLTKIHQYKHPILQEWGVTPEDDRPVRLALWECAQRQKIYYEARLERAKSGLPVDGAISVFASRVSALDGFCNKLLDRPTPTEPGMRK